MTETPEDWQAVVAVADMPESGIHEVVLGQRLVLIVRTADGFTAVQGLCPHQAARLKDGRVDAEGFLHCPRHMAKFRLVDGVCGGGWELPPLQRFATKIENGTVLIPQPLVPLT